MGSSTAVGSLALNICRAISRSLWAACSRWSTAVWWQAMVYPPCRYAWALQLGATVALQVRVGLWDVVQHPRLRVRLLIMVCVWFVVSLVRTVPPCILAMHPSKPMRRRAAHPISSRIRGFHTGAGWSLRMHTFLCLLSAFIGSSASTARETIADAYPPSHRMQAYYGSAFGMGQLSGSIYLNHVAIYAIEAPAYAASGFLIDRIGRRPVFVYALAECEAGAVLTCS
jgi:hypothetical protein